VVILPSQVREQAEDWLSALVQHSSDLIIVVDEQGRVLYANPVASVMFGVSLDEAIGMPAFRYVHPGDIGRVQTNLAAMVESVGEPLADTIRVVSAAGDVRVLETITTNCLHDPGISGLVINGRDVTERNDYITRLEASFEAIASVVANVVELRDPYTAGHQRQVAHIAGAVARDLDMADDEVHGIEVAATLHDVGKIAIPAEILTRPGRLSVAEFELIKCHPEAGRQIVAEVPFPWPVAEMIVQHHERLDGSGYPSGLRGEAILVGSRVIAVADVVSAMSAHRPYRPAVGVGAALAEIEAGRGRRYDAAVVDSCLRLFRQRAFPANPDGTPPTPG